jgi:hypothetical protein
MTPVRFARKVFSNLRLLRDDPERFAANVSQFSHPELFRKKLLDVLTASPRYLQVDRSLAARPAINILQPGVSPLAMTGGPNTIVNLSFWLAMRDVPVRLVTTQETDLDERWFSEHLASVTGERARPPSLTIVSALDPSQPLLIGPNDIFLATHWTTAQQVKEVLPRMAVKRFFYLIQDYEPGFYAWSSNYALALETYSLDHVGIVNERMLHRFLVAQDVGRYADSDFARSSLVFEPAVDRTVFHPSKLPHRTGRRRLLFYARPTNPRNMLGVAMRALNVAVADPVFQSSHWEFLAIGSRGSMPALPIGSGHVLRPAPWADYEAYANLLRESDVLLCPMLSPHTSYPVLEMVACGGISVTNTFAGKTRDELERISTNIVARPPTEEGLTEGLLEAARRVNEGFDMNAPLSLPSTWKDALSDTSDQIAEIFRELSTRQ